MKRQTLTLPAEHSATIWQRRYDENGRRDARLLASEKLYSTILQCTDDSRSHVPSLFPLLLFFCTLCAHFLFASVCVYPSARVSLRLCNMFVRSAINIRRLIRPSPASPLVASAASSSSLACVRSEGTNQHYIRAANSK